MTEPCMIANESSFVIIAKYSKIFTLPTVGLEARENRSESPEITSSWNVVLAKLPDEQ